MKIAVFHNLRKGGAKRVVFEIFKRLSLKHDIDLFTLTSADKHFLSLKKNVKNEFIFKISLPGDFFSLQYFIYSKLPQVHKKIATKIDQRNYDLVFVAHDFLTKSPYILRFLKTPTIYFCCEPPREFYEKWDLFSTTFKYKIVNLLRLPLKFVDFYNVKKANFLLANSSFSKKRLQAIYGRKFNILKHGVDIDKFRLSNKKREDFFLTVGGLALFKGYDFLIKSISKLPKKFRFPLVAVAENGRDSKKILKLSKQLNVELIIKKNLKDRELIDLYNKARLFLFAAHNEPLGLCILEATSCGLPVISVKEGGVPELFYRNYDGLVQRDIDKFSKKIINFLDKDNPRLRLKLRRHIKENWPWDESIKKLEKFLENVQRK